MRHLSTFLLFALVLVSASALAQPCTPNLGYTQPGYYPSPLPNPTVGIAYSQTVDFKFPSTTTFQGFTVNVDTVYIDSVKGLPPGINFVLNHANKTYLGGENGCGQLSGTVPVGNAGSHKIYLYGTAIVSAFGVPFPFPNTDTLDFYVNFPTGIQNAKANSLHVEMYPNPANEQANLIMDPVEANAQLSVSDLTGRNVFNKTLPMGTNQFVFPTASLASGIYQVSLQSATGTWSSILSVNR